MRRSDRADAGRQMMAVAQQGDRRRVVTHVAVPHPCGCRRRRTTAPWPCRPRVCGPHRWPRGGGSLPHARMRSAPDSVRVVGAVTRPRERVGVGRAVRRGLCPPDHAAHDARPIAWCRSRARVTNARVAAWIPCARSVRPPIPMVLSPVRTAVRRARAGARQVAKLLTNVQLSRASPLRYDRQTPAPIRGLSLPWNTARLSTASGHRK